MRVLHILNELCPSGAETMLYAALPYWNKLDVQVEILCTGSSTGSFSPLLRERGCRIHHLPFSKSLHFLRAVYRLLREQQYDVVHIQTERANFWYALLARLSGRCVIVRTINSVFQFSGPLRLRRFLQRKIMTRFFGVRMIAVSKSVQTVEARHYDNQATVISGWFDSARYRPPSAAERSEARLLLQIDPGATVIASVGNCWPVKNHLAIIQAMAQLPPDCPLVYIHAGQEDAGHSERIQAQRLGVEGRARFLGAVLDVRVVLHAADAFIMPSTYEGLGVAALEAMGTGLPCILSDVEGLRDYRVPFEGIVWVEPTPQSILAALEQICATAPAARKHIGTTLSETAHRLFGAEQGATVYAQLYADRRAAG